MGVEVLYNIAVEKSIAEQATETSNQILDEVFKCLSSDELVNNVVKDIERQFIEKQFFSTDLQLTEKQKETMQSVFKQTFYKAIENCKNEMVNNIIENQNKESTLKDDLFIYRIKKYLSESLNNTFIKIGEQYKREYCVPCVIDKEERVLDKSGIKVGLKFSASHYGKGVLASDARGIFFTTGIVEAFEKATMEGKIQIKKEQPIQEKIEQAIDVAIKEEINKDEDRTFID